MNAISIIQIENVNVFFQLPYQMIFGKKCITPFYILRLLDFSF